MGKLHHGISSTKVNNKAYLKAKKVQNPPFFKAKKVNIIQFEFRGSLHFLMAFKQRKNKNKSYISKITKNKKHKKKYGYGSFKQKIFHTTMKKESRMEGYYRNPH